MVELVVFKKIVEEAVMEVMAKRGKLVMPVNVIEVKQRIIYNIDAKCYDITLGLSPDDIDSMEIIKVLDLLNVCYVYERRKYNQAQLLLFKF